MRDRFQPWFRSATREDRTLGRVETLQDPAASIQVVLLPGPLRTVAIPTKGLSDLDMLVLRTVYHARIVVAQDNDGRLIGRHRKPVG